MPMSSPTPQLARRASGHLLWVLLALLYAAPAHAQAEPTAPTVPPAEYGKWETLVDEPELSPDGRWLAYRVQRVDRHTELRVRALDGEAEHVLPWGEAPEFSATGGWLAWTRGVSETEREELEEADEPAWNGAGVLDLTTGAIQEYDAVRERSFDETGRFLALLAYPPDDADGSGADLSLLDVSTGSITTFGNVSEYVWSDVNSQIAFAITTEGEARNGVQVFDPVEGRLRSLDTSDSAYRGLAWRETGADLAYLRSLDPVAEEEEKEEEEEEEDTSAHALVTWRGVDGDDPQRRVLSESGAWADEQIVRYVAPRWSDDGRLVVFGLRPEESEEEEEEREEARPEAADGKTDDGDTVDEDADAAEKETDDVDLPAVQIWHTRDVRLFPEQHAAEDRDQQRTLLAVWHVEEDRVVRLGTELSEDVELLEGWAHAVERTRSPYPWGRMFGRPYRDVWVIDTNTGARSKGLERERFIWESAGGRFLLSFDGEHYWSVELATGLRANITTGLGAVFANQEYDTPTDRLPPYGVGGWLEDDGAVLLYSRFDVWRVAPDGSEGRRLTNGAGDEVVHRVIDLDPEEDAIDPEQPLYLSLRGEQTERRGFARLDAAQPVAATLRLDDKWHGALTKAEAAEVYVFRTEARDDSPDYFVAGADLARPTQVTRTNPFQDDYAWTRSELLDFRSDAGVPLQAALLYPAGHDPTVRYPMIVYTYEILAPQIHRYQPPDERDYYNFTAWTQHGYFVLLPDIVYRPREPGLSALDAVRPAVELVVERGLVDRGRVGLIGHSWGGYQATFLPTRTDLFAAAVAGAPLTDFVSFMGQIHWNPGVAELSHWETGQARMEVPFWEDPDAHRRASPIHRVHEMETPLLMAFGDADGVVDWDQGTEFYNFARRAGKQMVLLVYEGEDHGFRRKANQIDYHRRILEWFGHYLQGQDAPTWITDGVPLAELDAETRRVAGLGPDR